MIIHTTQRFATLKFLGTLLTFRVNMALLTSLILLAVSVIALTVFLMVNCTTQVTTFSTSTRNTRKLRSGPHLRYDRASENRTTLSDELQLLLKSLRNFCIIYALRRRRLRYGYFVLGILGYFLRNVVSYENVGTYGPPSLTSYFPALSGRPKLYRCYSAGNLTLRPYSRTAYEQKQRRSDVLNSLP